MTKLQSKCQNRWSKCHDSAKFKNTKNCLILYLSATITIQSAKMPIMPKHFDLRCKSVVLSIYHLY